MTWLAKLLALVAAGVLAVGGWFFLTEQPLAVSVVIARAQTDVRVYGLGTVEARVVSRIGFEVGAALTALRVDNNDAVTAVQVLAELHPAEQQARVARAEAGVAGRGNPAATAAPRGFCGQSGPDRH